jgi:hypothetical protein
MKKWGLRLFRRKLSSPEPPPEFGVRLALRKGDKVVSRDTRGVIRILRVSERGDSLANAVRLEHGGDHVPPPEVARRSGAMGGRAPSRGRGTQPD